ncbi:MAG: PduL/EutD family phosphate acyltransferase [Ruthenibacterium lactatiformans]
MNILVETSARHVHVTEADLETLFGKGYQLTVKKELSQPGQYASNERVTVVGPKKELANEQFVRPVAAAPRRWSWAAEPMRAPLVLSHRCVNPVMPGQSLPVCKAWRRSGRRW